MPTAARCGSTIRPPTSWSSRSPPASSRCACRPAPASSARARATARSSTSPTATPTARFNPDVDKRSGYRTRCMLTLPLVDHKDVLVGVMQVLNKADGVFDADDEVLATALAAQCAVALQRVRMTAALIEGEKMRQELEMARVVQMSTLPARMPALPGYDVYGMCRPAGLTGGDTFDLAVLDQGLLAVLGDATGHGIGPALSVTQMQAMLRMAFRLGADLETRLHAGEQPARRHPARRPLHHRVHRSAGRVHAPAALPQRRPGPDPALPGGRRRRARGTSPRAFRSPRCASRRFARRSRWTCSRATSSCCSPTASTSTATPRTSSSARSASRDPARAPPQADGRAVGDPARGGAGVREGRPAGGRHDGRCS